MVSQAAVVRSSVSYRDLSIISSFECGAIEVFVPDHGISLVNNFQDIPNRYLFAPVLCGDFNVHNPIWGSDHLDANTESLILSRATVLVLLNDCSGTRINTNGNFSHIDRTLISLILLQNIRAYFGFMFLLKLK